MNGYDELFLCLTQQEKKEVGENKKAEKKEYSFYKMAIIWWLWITKN